MYSMNPITLDDAVAKFPVLVAMPDSAHVSAKYSHVPTIQVLRGLEKEGFRIHGVSTAKSRTAGGVSTRKHLVRLRHENALQGGPEAPEICVLNSHDGTSSYRVMAGMIRFACANGLICGDMFGEPVSIRHKGNIVDNVIDATYSVVESFPALSEGVQQLKLVTLDPEEANAFAKAAVAVRFDEPDLILNPQALLTPRRRSDTGLDLWSTFNRVQENLVRGGVRLNVKDANTPVVIRSAVREIKSVDQNVKINRALWTLAGEMAKLKAA